jgi:pyridoxal phosphate enzyme (YggS family)
MVESVDRVKVARLLERLWAVNDRVSSPLKVLVQINTSGEDNKGGCSVSHFLDLAAFIHQNCPHLQFCGLMTVGRETYNATSGANPDFLALVQCASRVRDALQIENIELSMGMSNNYAHAVEMGSTNVRIGTAIFGSRTEDEDSRKLLQSV